MMTAEQLKASILQFAMEGKLVEQRPEEGTGEGLFHQIQAEKSKLVKEGKIKKQKPLRAIDEDEKPFDIPESWRWVRFGEIVSFRMGKTPPREDLSFWKRDIPWVSIADMIDGGVVVKTKEGISQGAFEKKFGSLISPKGTLIMSFKLSVGKVSILGEDCVHNEAIISIFPFIDFNNSFRDYLFHMLPELSQYGHANKAVKGFTLNNSSISNMLVPLPPLQEQFRIVQKLELLAPFVKQYKSVSEKLDKLKPAALSFIVKLLIFNAGIFASQLFIVYVLGVPIDNDIGKWGIPLFFLLFNILFVIYVKMYPFILYIYIKKLDNRIKNIIK